MVDDPRRYRSEAATVSLSLIVIVAATAVSGFQQAPTFRASSNIVQVDARVFRGDQFVRDLGPDDFVVTEDGVRQKVQSVVFVDSPWVPSEPGQKSANTAQSTAATQTVNANPSSPSVWIFVFDTSHLSPAGLNSTRKAALQFLDDRWHQGDVGGVVSGGNMAHNRITSNVAELHADVAALKMPAGLASFRMDMSVQWPRFQNELEVLKVGVEGDQHTLSAVVGRACSEEPDQCRRSPPEAMVLAKAHLLAGQIQESTLSTLRTVTALSNGLAGMGGPKTIVFLSEGFAIDNMESQLREAVGDAARAGAHFYTIDARGLNKGYASSIVEQPVLESRTNADFDIVADGTNSLAVDTGGLAIKNENDVGRALDEIQHDAGTYYVIAYSPTNTNFDGKYRTIDVSVTRPGVKVRARRGYLALPPAMLLSPKPAPSAGRGTARLEPSVILSFDFVRTARVALEKSVEPAAIQAKRGFDAFAQSDYAQAASDLNQSLQLDQSNAAVAFVLGWAAEAVGDDRQAISAWRAAAAIDPKMTEAYLALADAYMKIGQPALAIQSLHAGLAALPNSTRLSSRLAEIQKGG